MKKITAYILVFCLAASMGTGIVFAEEQKYGIKEMTLEEVIKYAYENNQTLKDLRDDVKNKKIAYDDMQRRTRVSRGIIDKVSFSSMDEYALYKGYKLDTVKFQYEELLKTQELTEKVTYYNIEKLAYEIAQTEKDIEQLNKTKAKLEKDLDIAKLKLKLQMINQTQVDQASAAVKQMDTKIKLMVNVLVMKRNALKETVGIDRKVSLRIKPIKKEFKAVGEVNIEEVQEKAKLNRKDAIKLTNDLKVKENDYLLYDHYKAYIAFDDFIDKRDEYNKAKENYENDMMDITQKAVDAYDALINSEQEYNDALETYNNTAELHRVNKLKYDLGMISLVDLMNSELSLIQAEIALEKALDKNILANKKFEASYTLGDLEASAASASTSTATQGEQTAPSAQE